MISFPVPTLSMVLHACNFTTQEAETGRLWAQSQPGLWISAIPSYTKRFSWPNTSFNSVVCQVLAAPSSSSKEQQQIYCTFKAENRMVLKRGIQYRRGQPSIYFGPVPSTRPSAVMDPANLLAQGEGDLFQSLCGGPPVLSFATRFPETFPSFLLCFTSSKFSFWGVCPINLSNLLSLLLFYQHVGPFLNFIRSDLKVFYCSKNGFSCLGNALPLRSIAEILRKMFKELNLPSQCLTDDWSRYSLYTQKNRKVKSCARQENKQRECAGETEAEARNLSLESLCRDCVS